MIVLDASGVIELLLVSPVGRDLAQRIADPRVSLHAPHLLAVEVAQVVRRLVASGELPDERAAQVIDDLGALDISHYEHEPLLPRIWALRDNLTAYDAAYVSLAEVLDAPLLTLDAKLANAPGHTAEVELLQI